jgi:hypothetical protein
VIDPVVVFGFVFVLGALAFMTAVDEAGYSYTREPLRPEAPKPRRRRRAPAPTVYTDATFLKPRPATRRKPRR